MDPLRSISSIAASGMHAQSQRLKLVSENVANANSTSTQAGADPYRRKTITFEEMVDRNSGASLVAVSGIQEDQSAFDLRYEPGNPGADEQGYVKISNVSPILEMSNMRDAARSYEANMNMFEAARRMRDQLLDMLR